MRTLNLGILAHVDAGKTTLSERLLFTAGAIDHVGSVDAGTTQTDSLDLERERGITIRSAVASFFVGDLAVNLVDTPGHPDFIAEVERVLGVLDGAVLVVSAVEGVQPQTPLLFRALQRLHVPTLIFVNKLDRAGADPDRVVEAMRRRLSPGVLPMGTAREPGRPDATFVPFAADDATHRTALVEALAEHDEDILDAYVADATTLTPERLREQLGVQTRAGVAPPGLLRFRGAGHRDRHPPRRHRRASRRLDRRPGRGRLGPGLQDRADGIGRARRVRAPVRGHDAGASARAGRGRGGGQADVDPRLRPDRCAAPGRADRRRDGRGPRPGHRPGG